MKTFLSPLTAKEEQAYFKRWKEGDLEAKHALIEHNMRLVAHICRKYQNMEEDMGVSTFQEGYGSKLATYAARCIENELLMYFRSKKKVSREISLYEPIGTDKEGNQIQLMDVVESQDKDIVEQLELKRKIKKLYELMPQVLNEREKKILSMRYGLEGKKPVTQREIAGQMKISRSYVSRIEKSALEKLRLSFIEG